MIYLPYTEITISKDGTKVSGEDIYGVAGLGAAYKDWLSIEITGPYAEHLLFDLKRAFEEFCQYEKDSGPAVKYDLDAIKRDFERWR